MLNISKIYCLEGRTPKIAGPGQPVKYEEMVVGAVRCELFSAEFPAKQGKYREFLRF